MSRRALWSLIPPSLILLAAVPGAWPLLRAHNLDTGAGDWPAQVYRVGHLRAHGLASWTHDWAGGLPLWSAYQPAAHLVTAAAAEVTGAADTRAMTAALALVVLALPLAMYAALRVAGLAAAPALVGALLALVLDGRRQPTANFTEIWGLAITPLLLAMGFRSAGRRGGMVTALACGLAIYVHPLAAVAGLLGLPAGTIVHLPRRLTRRDAVKAAGTVLAQLLVWAGATAFFLLPAVQSVRPVYEDPYLSSAAFERLLAQLQVARFAPGWPLWLGLAAHGAGWVAWRGPARLRPGARFVLLLAAIVVALTCASILGWGPRLFRNTQLPRLLSLMPLLAATAGGLVAAAAAERCGRFPVGFAAALLPLAAVATGPGLNNAPAVRLGGFAEWVRGLPSAERGVTGRIAAAPELVAEASAAAPGRAWYTGSYSGQEWSVLGAPLAAYLGGFGTPETRAAYLTAMGVEHALVPHGSHPPLAHPLSGQPVAWEFVTELAEGDILRLPWRAPVAAIVPSPLLAGLDLPDRAFTNVAESYIRDELTRQFAALLAGPQATPAAIRAPTPERLLVSIPPQEGGTLILSVNWDRSWRAQADSVSLAVRRAGPNYLAAEIPPSAIPIEIAVWHQTPWAWFAGALVTVGTLAAVTGLALAGPVGRMVRYRAARSRRVT